MQMLAKFLYNNPVCSTRKCLTELIKDVLMFPNVNRNILSILSKIFKEFMQDFILFRKVETCSLLMPPLNMFYQPFSYIALNIFECTLKKQD